MKVRDLMRTDLITVSPEADLAWADDVMGIAEVRHLPVVADDRLVGLLTSRDLLRVSLSVLADLESEQVNSMMHSVKVRLIMNTAVATAEPGWDLRDAIELMMDHKYGCLPVVENERLVGIITESDFLRIARDLVLLKEKPWFKRALSDDDDDLVEMMGERP